MCGIVGVFGSEPVNQLIYDSLLLLQHRGQDSAGIATDDAGVIHLVRARGLVNQAFRTRDMRTLLGCSGLGHVRYTTRGSASHEEESQPFYVNAPYGITMVHNGNLTNAQQLSRELFEVDRRHLNTSSDSEVLLNVFAHALQQEICGHRLDPEQIFRAVTRVHERAEGSYAAIALIAGAGLLAFRDPHGIRPLVLGARESRVLPGKIDYILASESVALEAQGFVMLGDISPGEAVFIGRGEEPLRRRCAAQSSLNPCAFEYVYLARPDSVMSGISVYEARLRLGDQLAETIAQRIPSGDIDVVIPIPDSSRPAALQVSRRLGVEYREGILKNRYVGRTFIMPGQLQRKKSVRQKLNAMNLEFQGKNVLIVDDSIVRGTTSREIVQMARSAGAARVFFTSAAPPVRYQNVFGINMPSTGELVAHGRSTDEICALIDADSLVYQTTDSMRNAIMQGSRVSRLEDSCFTGEYVTGRVTPEYLSWVENNQSS